MTVMRISFHETMRQIGSYGLERGLSGYEHDLVLCIPRAVMICPLCHHQVFISSEEELRRSVYGFRCELDNMNG